MRRIIDICWRLCKQVPLLPITILSAIPLALLGEWKPWGEAECVQSGRWAVDCDRVGCVHDCGDGTRHDRRSAARACWRRSAGGRRDCVDGRSAGILGRMGRGADDLVRRSDRGIRAVKGRKQPDRADRRGTANRARGRAARHAGACARVGQRAYGRRDRRRISYCQSVRFWRNGQPRR